MRALLVVVVLGACNQVLGVGESQLIDAPGPDAPFTCPQGKGELGFSYVLHQAITQACSAYVIGPAGNAMADCTFAGTGVVVSEAATADTTLVPAKGFSPENGVDDVLAPRPGLDADTIYVTHHHQIGPTDTVAFETFVRSSGAWKFDSTLPIPATSRSQMSNAIRDTGGLHAIITDPAKQILHEWMFDGSSWRPGIDHTYASLEIDEAIGVTLSPDGLAIVFEQSTKGTMMYALRDAITSGFGTATALTDVPLVPSPFLYDHCARLYFSGLDSVFYVQQN